VDHSPALDPPRHDYEADDVLVVADTERIRALADDLRAKIVVLLRERARSITELAGELGLPKGTVGHHVKVLEKAGLIRVVRTRQVRALTEKYYGRVARLFVVKSADEDAARSFAAAGLRQAADEVRASGVNEEIATFGLVHARLREADAKRLMRRLDAVVQEFRERETPEGDEFGLALALYPLEPRP
jgi:DNA-binding transcriptional ArsR family regulator